MIQSYLKELYKKENKNVQFNGTEYKLNSRYKIGKININNKLSTLDMLNQSSQKIFIENHDLNGAYEGDIALVQVMFNPKGKTKAKVIEVLDRGVSQILCMVKDKELYTIKENILIDCEDVRNKEGDVVIFQNGKIIQKLGTIYDPAIDEIISLSLYGEISRLDPYSTDIKKAKDDKRTDLRDLDFCTIDPVGAKDFDDAVYFDEGSSTLYVAIADVSSYVQEGSSLDIEAQKRAFSIYLPHKVLPMLPFELSNNLCSLVPEEDRLAYVFKMKLDIKKQKVTSSELFEAVINSKRRYTYEEIDDILEKNDKENYFVKLYDITKLFRRARLKNGYDFRNEELRQKLDENNNLESIQKEDSTPSHSLIEECMLLANQEAAKKLKTLGVFRVHDEPTQPKIAKLVDDVNMLGLNAKLKSDVHSTIVSIQQKAKNVGLEKEIDELIIQSQQQAAYSSIKKEHFGLGFKDYSHFTSPIRRYADLVLHRILKTGKIPKDIEETCIYISQKERDIAQLVWDFEDRKYARWAYKNIGKNIEAKVVDAQNHLAETTENIEGLRAHIENYSGEKLFTPLNLRITKSDFISKKISAMVL
ncbi:MAG: ribonuclease R family protein [Campylobacterota bacterium]|nr:ribonuclease R family protein [Campylobacterota bacterium]